MMSKRKSVDTTETESKVIKRDIYVVKEKRNPIVEDFLPDYNLKYNVDTDEEANTMVESMLQFIRANEELVLDEYNSSNLDAVMEGFARGVAMCSLFIHSLYIDGDVDGEG